MISSYLPRKRILRAVLPWVLVYIALNIGYHQDGDVNAYSRYAAMRAMSMDGTFSIDSYRHWTIDWAYAPNGHYYSNKAPGPIFIGFPLFWLIDHLKLATSSDFATNYQQLSSLGYEHKITIPLVFQILPYCLLVMLIAKFLEDRSVGYPAIMFTTIALLFGNTAALFLTTWFGHGLSAWLVLAMLLCLHEQRYTLFGLVTGFAILSDYSNTFFLIPVVIYMIYNHSLNLKNLVGISRGALLPASLWIWYHTVNFGSPFHLPNMYQNPEFGASTLGGQFQFPKPYYMMVLLTGDERGILFTQPWVLAVLLFGGYRLLIKRTFSKELVSLMAFMGFGMLLLMNSSFVGWHGGSTPGPRYLSTAFPLFAILAGLYYDKLAPWERHILWIFLGVSILFGGLVYGTTILAYEYYTIWTWLLDYLHDYGGGLRIVLYLLAIFATGMYTFRYKLTTNPDT